MAIPGALRLAAATFGALTAGMHAPVPERPVTLVTYKADDSVVIRLLGTPHNKVSVRYRLEITGSGPGGNRVEQSGFATLAAGAEPRTLATVRVTGTSARGRLVVEIDGGEKYEEPIDTLK